MSRKIEDQMIAAIRARKDWHSGNTRVENNDRFTRVFLHGHQIGSIDNQTHKLAITLAGWNTNTTRGRVSALCREFGTSCGVSNNERKGGPHMIYRDGTSRLIDSHLWWNA